MNEFRDEVVSSGAAQAHSKVSKDLLGRSGQLYAIEVEAVPQSDGRILLKGWASDHNPHDFQRIDESFFV